MATTLSLAAVKPSYVLHSEITEEPNSPELGPHPTALFDSYSCRDCTYTCSPALGIKGTTDRKTEIILLEETIDPTDLNEAPRQTPAHAQGSSIFEEKTGSFVVRLPENEGTELGQT